MATREYLATVKAQATQRIEASVPDAVKENWPAKGEDRFVAMLDYVAGVFDRSAATKKAAAKMEAPPAEPESEPEPVPQAKTASK